MNVDTLLDEVQNHFEKLDGGDDKTIIVIATTDSVAGALLQGAGSDVAGSISMVMKQRKEIKSIVLAGVLAYLMATPKDLNAVCKTLSKMREKQETLSKMREKQEALAQKKVKEHARQYASERYAGNDNYNDTLVVAAYNGFLNGIEWYKDNQFKTTNNEEEHE